LVVSDATRDVLGIPRKDCPTGSINPCEVVFEDVSVTGTSEFGVSSELFVHATSFGGDTTNIDDAAFFDTLYNSVAGPVRTQLSPPTNDIFLSGLDVLGMPLIAGRTMVMDARPLNDAENLSTMVTSLHISGDPIVGLPAPDRRIATSYGDFSRFTRTFARDGLNNETTLDAASFGPTLVHNPFIGPDPTGDSNEGDPVPGITAIHNGATTTTSWLLDSGASASIVSEVLSAAHDVQYRAGHGPGSLEPQLERISDGTLVPNQFQQAVGGISGTLSIAGFSLDKVSVQTIEGDSLDYLNVPVLVLDISVLDPTTQESITLDAVFGMNMLVASAEILGGLPGDIHVGAYDFISFDEPSGVLSLVFNVDLDLPEPSSFSLVTTAFMLLLAASRRNRRR